MRVTAWDRSREGRQKNKPKVIGLDIYRDIPHPPGREELREALKADNLVAIAKVDGSERQNISPPPGVPKERVGFSDLVIDNDNVLRRNLMYAESDKEKFYSLALQVSLKYLRDRNLRFQVTPDALQIGKTSFWRLREDAGGYQMSPSEALGWQTLIQYRSAKDAVRQVSLTDVLEGKVAERVCLKIKLFSLEQ
ncbi:MAG: CHASE2 domain-containing protein [Hydrococcus sp. RM1_1_31]|nr:CHASE2 domain-containing protein [Hydrococcus sp. RM1_1_31]